MAEVGEKGGFSDAAVAGSSGPPPCFRSSFRTAPEVTALLAATVSSCCLSPGVRKQVTDNFYGLFGLVVNCHIHEEFD